MELPKELIDQHRRDKEREAKAESKRRATHEYRRRKLDKDVRLYTRERNPIRGGRIESIGRKHKFFIEETPFREDQPPHADA